MTKATYVPNPSDLGQLIALLKMPGYQILTRVFEGEIDMLQVDMINADPINEKEVLKKHNLALAAGIFHRRILDRLNYLQEEFAKINNLGRKEVIPDQTQELLGY